MLSSSFSLTLFASFHFVTSCRKRKARMERKDEAEERETKLCVRNSGDRKSCVEDGK